MRRSGVWFNYTNAVFTSANFGGQFDPFEYLQYQIYYPDCTSIG